MFFLHCVKHCFIGISFPPDKVYLKWLSCIYVYRQICLPHAGAAPFQPAGVGVDFYPLLCSTCSLDSSLLSGIPFRSAATDSCCLPVVLAPGEVPGTCWGLFIFFLWSSQTGGDLSLGISICSLCVSSFCFLLQAEFTFRLWWIHQRMVNSIPGFPFPSQLFVLCSFQGTLTSFLS